MTFRPYDAERDREATQRIWREIGWLSEGDAQKQGMEVWVGAGEAHVAELNGQAECLVLTCPGAMRYLEGDLPFCGVTGVTTSRVARRQGLATRLTARALAERAEAGDYVAGLGMFEQGFYNRLGMGTGSYEHEVSFDPARLNVVGTPRIPVRLGLDDAEQMHAARVGRQTAHGAVTLWASGITRGEMLENSPKGFGLGYRDGPDGTVSHFLWLTGDNISHGPYRVGFMAYRNGREFIELLQMLKGLGDQVHRVTILEPGPHVLQDFVDQPLKQSMITRQAAFETGVRALAWWQCRMLKVEACLSATSVLEGELAFNLELDDPIERYLPADATWRGAGGQYVVELGPEGCGARRGSVTSLPTLRASVGAFTRLWLGARIAQSLAVTDPFEAPDDLLASLGRLLRIPQPHIDWPL